MKFAQKYPEKLSSSPMLMAEALKACGAALDPERILAANGSWYYVLDDGKEVVKTADFEFLLVDEKSSPVQYNLSWEGGKWSKPEKKDLAEELGQMKEEADLLKSMEKKLLSEEAAVKAVEGKLMELRKGSPHLRITLVAFSVSDQEYEVPAWRVEANNWPIISYFKSREKQKSAVAVLDALDGKILSFKAE